MLDKQGSEVALLGFLDKIGLLNYGKHTNTDNLYGDSHTDKQRNKTYISIDQEFML